MRKTLLSVYLVLSIVPVAYGQQTQQAPAPQPPAAKLERADQLEQENIRLLALVTSLQKELAEARLQLQQSQLQQRASTFIEKMKTAHPEFEVDPQTLELKPKAKAAPPKNP